MASPPGLIPLAAELDRLVAAMQRLQSDPTIGGPAVGVPEWDWRLWRLGRELLPPLGRQQARLDADGVSEATGGPRASRDVYLASQLYDVGGHTALIGDFVTALAPSDAHLLITDAFGASPGPLPRAILERVCVPDSQVTVLAGPTMADRARQMMERLAVLRPDRLFLFHHPQDPLASLAAQPELARTRVLVHHADATPSFGLFVPGITIIDLNPHAVAPTRLLGRASHLLQLTSPDPGPRPAGFLRRGHLVTASCGSPHKFAAAYAYRYADTVAAILRATGGRHVHIGPLSAEAIAEIHAALDAATVPRDCLTHIPRTASVAQTLWDHACDVYCASFPVDGARTRVEVLASGTPYLRHARQPADAAADPARDPDGLWTWRTWEDLAGTLAHLSDADRLAASGAVARSVYDQIHHPAVFRRRLLAILEGVSPETVSVERLLASLGQMVQALQATRRDDLDMTDRLAALRTQVAEVATAAAEERETTARVKAQLEERLDDMTRALADLWEDFAALRREQLAAEDGLDGQAVAQAALQAQIAAQRSAMERWQAGTGLKGALWRWLTR